MTTQWTYEILKGRRVIVNGEPLHEVVIKGDYQEHELYTVVARTPQPDGTTVLLYRDNDPNLWQSALELMRNGWWESEWEE